MEFWQSLVDDLVSPHFPIVLRAVLAMLLTLVFSWVVLTLLIAVVNRQLAIRIAPPIIRALLIAGMATMLAQPAHAQESGANSLHGLTLPDRPDTSPGPGSSPATQGHGHGPPSETSHQVSPGDTLWGIARAHLAATASDTEIAQSTRAWHESNKHVIGNDPDLIHPGQDLKEPTT